MHELSIALSLIDVASEQLARLGAVRVEAIRLRVGPLSGVATDALHFSFALAAAGTPIDGARLDIDEVPVAAWCDTCAAERALVSPSRRRCPECGTPTPRIVRGAELELLSLEVVDA